MIIKTIAEFQTALDNGPYAWPGGYPVYFITQDGAALSFDAVKLEQEEIKQAITDQDLHSDWRVIGLDINWEDASLYCDHTGKRIESAYAEEEFVLETITA